MRSSKPSMILLLTCGLLACTQGESVQAQQEPAFTYEAYYQVSYGDLEEWNRQYFEYVVPILTDLQDEGIIDGWGHYHHQTGGEYNVRLAVRTYDWLGLDTFWDEYLSRLQASVPETEWAATNRMIQAHHDEIWDIARVNVPEGAPWEYMYASTYRHNFADGAEWQRIWMEVAAPIIDQAMTDGLLTGWVVYTHNTGGSHNFKVLYMFDDWDKIDDFFQSIQGQMAENHSQDFETMSDLILAHDDRIWMPTTEGGTP